MKQMKYDIITGAVLCMLIDNPAVTAFLLPTKRIPSITHETKISAILSARRDTPILRNTANPKRYGTTDKVHETDAESTNSASTEEEEVTLVGVVAPLHQIGPYRCLSLQFPDWKNDDGDENAVYDFMIDSGANVNSIDATLVEKFNLNKFSLPATLIPPDDAKSTLSSSSLVGATTTKSGNETVTKAGTLHMLGNCQLAGLPPPRMVFLRYLVAASLPYASPVGAGLLGLPFLWTFPAGIEFDWHGTDGDPPTIIFYYGKEAPLEAAKMDQMVRSPVQALIGGLMMLKVSINNIKMRALLDTGSPLTVLNDQACKLIGMETKADLGVKIAGVDGSQSVLRRLEKEVSVEVLSDDKEKSVCLGTGHIWSGPLAGIDMIRKLDNNSKEEEPAAVLGLDFLQNAYRMLLRASSNEVWFEELPKGFK